MATLLSTDFATGCPSTVFTTSGSNTFGGTGAGTMTAVNGGAFEGYATTKNTAAASMGAVFRMNQPGTPAGHHVRLAIRSTATPVSGDHGEGTTGVILEWDDATTTVSWYGLNASDVGYDPGLAPITVSSQIGAWWWHRVELQGTTYRYRYWKDGTSEPATWTVNQTISTGTPNTGYFTISSGNYSGGTAVLQVDDFQLYDFTVTPVQGAAAFSSGTSLTAAAIRAVFSGTGPMSSASALTAAGAGLTALGTLRDTFTNLTQWSPFGGATASGGRVAIPVTTGFSGIQNTATWSLFGSSVSARLTPPAAGGATAANVGMFVAWAADTANNVQVLVDGATGLISFSNEVGYYDPNVLSLPYDPVNHAFVRVREAAGTTYWDTSPDGATWTNRRASANAAWLSQNPHRVVFQAHRDAGTADAAYVSSLNLPAVLGAVDLSAASSLSADGDAQALPPVVADQLDMRADSGLVVAGVAFALQGAGVVALSASGSLVILTNTDPPLLGEAALSSDSGLAIEASAERFAEVELLDSCSALGVEGIVYPIRYLFVSPTMRVPALCGTPFTRRLQTTVGVTVVRDDGFWREIADPVDMGAYDVVYLGGYEHWISRAEYLELLDAGYGEYLTVLEPQVPLTPVSAGFGSSAFGSGPFGQDGIPYATGVYGENTYQETT